MTTIDAPHAPTTDAPAWPVYAAVSAGTALVLTAIGTFWAPLSDYEATGGWDPTYLVIVGVIALLTGVVFGLVVRTATPENADRRGLVLGALGLVSIVGFWTGAPAVLAGGAACCALLGGTRSRTATATLVLAAVTVVIAIWGALAG